jgi:hypothetical protein
LTNANYNITFVNGSLIINPATPTLTWGHPADIEYGTALGGAQLNAAADVAGALAYNPASGIVLNAGNGQSLNVTFTPTDSLNYTPASVTVTINVNPAPLTVTADSLSRGYGATNPVFTAGYNGFVNNDGSGVLSGTLSFSCLDTNSVSVDTNTPVGTYPIVVSGQSAANYNLSYVAGDLTVTQAVLTVSADSLSRPYGATNPILTASYSGFVNNEDTNVLSGSPDLGTAADTNSAVGTYPIEISLGNLATNGNYSFSFTNGTLTVTAYTLTIQVDSQTRTYGQANAPLSGTLTGLQNGDAITAGYTTSADTNTAVGAYPITVSLTDPDGNLSNYSVITNGGTVTVNPAALTVKAQDDFKTYNGVAFNGGNGVSYTGFVNNEDNNVLAGTLTFIGNSQGAINTGSYTITPAGLTNANYNITFANGSLTVTPAILTITADNKSKTQGLPNPGLTASYSGFVTGENTNALTTQVTLSTAANVESPAAAYSITASGAAAANYTINYVGGTLTVVAQPDLGGISISGNQFTLTWPTIVGQTYQVEYKDRLDDPAWTPLGSAIAGTGNPLTVHDDNNGAQHRFYRLKITQP